jgi:hypothetical protein
MSQIETLHGPGGVSGELLEMAEFVINTCYPLHVIDQEETRVKWEMDKLPTLVVDGYVEQMSKSGRLAKGLRFLRGYLQAMDPDGGTELYVDCGWKQDLYAADGLADALLEKFRTLYEPADETPRLIVPGERVGFRTTTQLHLP